ncbi:MULTISPECIES: urease accessory UreF family protein [unclassified Amycolatopsis]|uniref:urease accessory protein UreF n=1 Tax=unclassified Amycolatopsis TaxID=2618356 RepID=UPI0028751BFF|nr:MULTISPECIES: urease accessory UreF family protein [unclassified Amycolatopsis]MDS0133348.1 urease accessory protein UreF [Amycolatopsis sp. 505]MDS0146578.1 urease accessory protein UreF [Amycolatopsis sp. CM201R]
MDLSALILADSRFPGGGHVHSGGLEEVVARKLVTSVRDLPGFLSGRLRTAGFLAAVFAAASAHAAANRGNWSRLDSELDARTPSLAQREASRAQGRGTARAGRIAWPSPVLEELLAETPRPHHPIVLGALVGVAGGSPYDAAMAVAYLSVSGPASAAVRLLGLDPFAVNAVVARLDLASVCSEAAAVAGDDPASLPSPGSPALDLFAEAHARHHQEEVRLFAS